MGSVKRIAYGESIWSESELWSECIVDWSGYKGVKKRDNVTGDKFIHIDKDRDVKRKREIDR